MTVPAASVDLAHSFLQISMRYRRDCIPRHRSSLVWKKFNALLLSCRVNLYAL